MKILVATIASPTLLSKTRLPWDPSTIFSRTSTLTKLVWKSILHNFTS